MTLLSWCESVPSSPGEVAGALRLIADRIEADDLTLIGLWVTGFGEPWEACLQVVAGSDTDDAG